MVLGDSGTGKTYLFNGLVSAISNRNPWTYECFNHLNKNNKVMVYAVSDINMLKMLLNSENNSVIVIDEDTTQNIRKNDMIGNLRVSNNYFILMDRQLETKLDVNVKAMFKIEEKRYKNHKVFEFKQFIDVHTVNLDELDIRKITHMIVEDTTSGKIFWEKVFSKINLLTFKNYGNGSIKENIEKALKNINGDLLIAIDYDEGGVQIHQIYDSKNIDFNRLYFIPLESFEELVCNSEFILSKYPNLKELVVNYKMYITPVNKSTGKYFSDILFRYVKVKPPISPKNNRNATKFYKKGAVYFEECFINNCCNYNNDCKMYYDGDKKRAMLSNKFEGYRVFI